MVLLLLVPGSINHSTNYQNKYSRYFKVDFRLVNDKLEFEEVKYIEGRHKFIVSLLRKSFYIYLNSLICKN